MCVCVSPSVLFVLKGKTGVQREDHYQIKHVPQDLSLFKDTYKTKTMKKPLFKVCTVQIKLINRVKVNHSIEQGQIFSDCFVHSI